MLATMSKSKAKKLMMKTNQSTTGIINMVSHLTNVVGYSNVMPFLEHDAGNLTNNISGIITRHRNKDTFGKKHRYIIDDGNIPNDGNEYVGKDNDHDNNGNININVNVNVNDGNDDCVNADGAAVAHGDGDGGDGGAGDGDGFGDGDGNGDGYGVNDDDIDDDETDAYVEAETDSLASMETLSDNVAIWVDGERHWVSGVDENTTCMDLICALLNYQNAQQMSDHDTIDRGQDNLNLNPKPNLSLNQNQSQYPNPNLNDYDFAFDGKNTGSLTKSGYIDCNNAINQSMPRKTGKQETTPSNISNMKAPAATAAAFFFERNVVRASEYVIVKQHRHCEEYLDGNAKVFDVLLPTKSEGILSDPIGIGVSNRKECELFLRRLVNSTAMTIEDHHVVGTASAQHAGNTQVASLLSTDKDSGMGSPVGSSRSARFRRRKYKSATWFSQSNTLHPKVTERWESAAGGGGGGGAANNNYNSAANERLMRIILAQDETIHRQLSMLREKERQICKIEEEKHRVRERELGKNYLLETYFKGLDEAVREPDKDADEEIFIDEPHQRRCEIVGTAANTGTSQQRSSRFNKKVSISQQHSNQLGNNISSDVVKANKSVTSKIETSSTTTVTATTGAAAAAADAPVAGDAGSQNEIEMQIFWLEKVYALNKQLQREEETLLKLHAKIRKHQVRCAYQMKNDVLEQIDELDAKLALQCADICRVEDNLVTSDEQLRGKMSLLQNLNAELQEIQEKTNAPSCCSMDASNVKGPRHCDQQRILLNNNVNVKAEALEIRPRKCKRNVETKQESNCDNQTLLRDAGDDNDDGDHNVDVALALAVAVDDDCANDVDNVDVDGCMELRGSKTTTSNIKVDDIVDTVVTTAVVSPMTKLALSTSALHSSSLSQQQQQQKEKQKQKQKKQNLNIMPQKNEQNKQFHDYPTTRVNHLDKCTFNFNSDSPVITIHHSPADIVPSKPMAQCDKNILPHQSQNAEFIKKPMFETLSPTTTATTATTITTTSTATKYAVKCQQQLPTCMPTTLIATPMFALKDSNAIDLSRLGTLV